MSVAPGLAYGVQWPNGARCAACISWDVPADWLVLRHELYAALSWLLYDEVAVPAIAKEPGTFGITQTFLLRRVVHRALPGRVRADPREWALPAAGERGGADRASGRRDDERLACSALVRDLGYVMSPESPAAAMGVFRSEFDVAYELGGLWITIWHPHVTGRPVRLVAWTKLVEYMLGEGGSGLPPWTRSLDTCRHAAKPARTRRVVPFTYYAAMPGELAGLGPLDSSGSPSLA